MRGLELDALARQFGETASRHRLLQGIAGLTLGAAVGGVGDVHADDGGDVGPDTADAGNGGTGSVVGITGDVSVGTISGDGNEVTIANTIGPQAVDASGGDDNAAPNVDVDADVDIGRDIVDSNVLRDTEVKDSPGSLFDAGDETFEE